MSRTSALSRAVLGLAALAMLLCTKDAPASWADGSRLGTIQALVEHGTLSLDDTEFFWQGDKVLSGGHYYSHQPPMQALLGALPYAALHHFGGRGIRDPFTYRVLTWFTVGLPVLLGLWALSRLLAESGCGPRWAAAWLAIAYFATLLLPYSLVLNQHGTAAGLSLFGLLAATRGRAVAAGAVMSLAATVDLTAAFTALAFSWPVARAGGTAAMGRYALSALPVVALHLGVNRAIIGDFWPIAVHTEAFAYPLSPFLVMPLTGDGAEDLAGTQSLYSWRLLFGQSGLFSNHPVLLIGALAALALLATRARHRLPPGALPAILVSSLGIAAYYATQSRNFGGSAFGVRWFAVFAPLLVLPAAAWQGSVSRKRASPPALRGRGAALTALALALWSCGAAVSGAVQPWSKIAWLRAQSTEAVLDRETLAPTALEHLRREWRRLRDFEQRFDRRSYEDFYQELLRRHALMHLRSVAGFSEEQHSAWRREALVTQHSVLRELERDATTAELQAVCHFWLGKLYAKLGDVPSARRHLDHCLKIITAYGPALKALQELPPIRHPGS